MVNLCIVNEDHPPCNVPRKTIKACPGGGLGALSLTWRAAAQPLFLHRISVVRVYLYIAATTADPEAGICVIIHCWWECRLVQPLRKTVWNFLRKLKMELPFDLAIPLLRLCPKHPETPIQKNLCTPMFIAAQFTIAKCWKQPKCPSVNEWIQKLWYIYTMEYYAAEKKGAPTLRDSMYGTGEHYVK